MSAAELVMIAIAGAGVAGWIVADEPIVATVCVVAADLVGAALMLPKTYRDPDSETLLTFALASVGRRARGRRRRRRRRLAAAVPGLLLRVNAAIALLIVQRRRTLERSGHPGAPPGWAAAGS